MGYERKVYDEAKAELDRRRHAAEDGARAKQDEFFARCPEAAKIRSEIASNAASVATELLKGGDPRAELQKHRERAAELNAEYDRLLRANGFTREDLEPKYFCDKCNDTGIYEGKMCSCFRQLERSAAYKELSVSAPLDSSAFGAFTLDYYKDDRTAYGRMEKIFRSCRDYADSFHAHSPSFLFWGGTGLGKTHLSLAIAGEVIAKGFGVVYGPAYTFASALEKERFDRPDGESDVNSRLVSCDLLILDDLGTEPSSDYVRASLYNVINSRILADKPTIISTNLTLNELQDRYSSRFVSRIAGCYSMLEFLGSDVRVQKRLNRMA